MMKTCVSSLSLDNKIIAKSKGLVPVITLMIIFLIN